MTCYCIYLSDEKNSFIEEAGVFPTESLAYVVAQNLADLIKKNLLFHTYNDFQELITSIKVIKYSEDEDEHNKVILTFNPLEEN